MDLNELLHVLVGHLPIHEKAKKDLHDAVDSATSPSPEANSDSVGSEG